MFFISYKYDLMGGIIFHLFFILAKKAPANSFSRSLQALDFKEIFNIAYSLLFTKCFFMSSLSRFCFLMNLHYTFTKRSN